MILEEEADEEARHERPEDADVLQHLADAEALGGGLGLRERLSHERQAVERRGHEEEAELHLPADAHAVAENPADETAEHQASRPARVENVQVMGAVTGEQRGDERVGHGLEGAVGQGEDERAQVEKHVGGVLGLPLGRRKRDEGRQHMKQERRDDQLAVADLVDDDDRR